MNTYLCPGCGRPFPRGISNDVSEPAAAPPVTTPPLDAETLARAMHNEVIACKFTEEDEYNACPGPKYHRHQASLILKSSVLAPQEPDPATGRDLMQTPCSRVMCGHPRQSHLDGAECSRDCGCDEFEWGARP